MPTKTKMHAAVATPPPADLKNYQVRLVAYAVVLVLKAESKDKAIQYATEDTHRGDFELAEAVVECEVPEHQVAKAKHHAHHVAQPEPVRAAA